MIFGTKSKDTIRIRVAVSVPKKKQSKTYVAAAVIVPKRKKKV